LAKKGVIQETIQLNIVTQLNNLDKAVADMRKQFSTLNLTQTTEKDFNKSLSIITEKIKNLRTATQDGVIKFADQKQAEKDIKSIQERLQRLGIDTDFLGVNEQKLKSTVKIIDQMVKAQNEYAKAIDDANKKEANAQNAVREYQPLVDNISKIVDNYENLSKQLRDTKAELTDVRKAYKEATKEAEDFKKANQGKNDSKTREKQIDLNKKAGYKKAAVTRTQNKVNKLQSNVDNYDFGDYKNITAAKQALNGFNKKLLDAKKTLEDIKKQDIGTKEFDKLKNTLLNAKDINWSSFNIDISSIKNLDDLERILNNLKNGSAQGAAQAIDAVNDALGSAKNNADSTSDEIGSVVDQFDRLASQKSEIESLRQSVVNFFGMQNAIQLFKRAVQEAYDSVKELDAAMTETAVVTDFSVNDMWEQLPEYTKMANNLGTSTLGAYETATLFYQQGLKTNEVMQVSVETMKMARIAGMDYVEATNMMTAALRGFNMEINEVSARRVNDVYSELAKITASDTQEISTAMTKTASIAHNANMEFETTAAFLSQIIETTRESAETAGTAMKTIIARFTELKKNPNEIVSVDGEEVNANKVEAALRSVGVALRDTNGEFRQLDDVFLDLASKWDSLSTNQQRYVATMAAGSRQQSRFIAMMSDYDRTIELVDAAYNSAGSSQEQFEKTVESLESKLNRLHNAWQGFTMGIANNAIIKTSIDLLTKFVSAINKVTEVGGEATSLIGKLGVSFAAFKIGGNGLDAFWTTFSKGIQNNIGPMRSFNEGLKSIGKSNLSDLKQIPGVFDKIKETLSGTSSAEGQLKNLQAALQLFGDETKKVKQVTAGKFIITKDNINTYKQLETVLMTDTQALGVFTAAVDHGVSAEAAASLVLSGNTEKREENLIAAIKQAKGIDNLTKEELEEILVQSRSSQNLAVQNKLRLQQLVTLGKSKEGTKQLAESFQSTGTIGSAVLKKLAGLAAALGVSLGTLIGIAAAVVVAIAAIGTAIYLNSDYKKLKDLNEEIEKTQNALSDAREAYKGLVSDLDDYDAAVEGLNDLVVGSTLWKDKLVEINQQVDELLAKYPELAQYVTTDKNGISTFNKEGIEKIKQKRQEQISNLSGATANATREKAVFEINSKYKKEVNETEKNYRNWRESNPNKTKYLRGFYAEEKNYKDAMIALETSDPTHFKANKTAAEEEAKTYTDVIEKAEKRRQERVTAENRKYIQSIAPDLKNTDAVAALVENKLNVEDRTKKYNRMVSGGALLGTRTGHDFGNYYGNNDAEKLYQELTGLSPGDEGYLKRGKQQKEAVARILANQDIQKDLEDLDNKIASDTSAIGEALRGNYDKIEDATKALKNDTSWQKYSAEVQTYFGQMKQNIEDTQEYFGITDLATKFGSTTDAVNAKNNIEKIQGSNLYGDAKNTITSILNAADSKFMSKLLDDLDQLGNIDYSSSINSYKTLKAIADETDNAFSEVASTMLQNISVADQMSEAFYGLSEDELKSFSEDPSAKQVLALSKTNEKVGQMLENTGTSFSAFGRILEQLQEGIISTTDLTDSYISALQKMYRSQDIIEDTFARIDDYNSSLTESQTAISDFYNSQRKEIEELYDKGAYGDKRLHQMIINLFGEDNWNKALENSGYKEAIDTFMGKIKQLNGTFYEMFASLPKNNIWSVDSNGSIVTNLNGINGTQDLVDKFMELTHVSKETAEAAIADLQTFSSDLSLQLQQLDYSAGMEDLLRSSLYKTEENSKNWYVDLSDSQLAQYAPALGIDIEDPTVAAQKAKEKIKEILEDNNDGLTFEVIPRIDNKEFKAKVETQLLDDWNSVSSNFLDGDNLKIDPTIDADGFQDQVDSLLQQQYNHLIIDCGLDPSEAKEELEQFWTEERIQKLFPDVPEEQREVIKNQITTSIADGTYNPVVAAQQKYMAKMQEIQMRASSANGIIDGFNAAIRQFQKVHPYLAKFIGLTAGKDSNNEDVVFEIPALKTDDQYYDKELSTLKSNYEKALNDARKASETKEAVKTNTGTRKNKDGTTTTSYTKPKGRTDTSSSSSSSSKAKNDWENPYDRLYNLTQQINAEIRKRNRLESEYNRLVERGLGNASQLAAKTDQERKSLEQQKALQEKLLAERKADLQKLNNNAYSKYAHYDMATGNVVINYDAINKNKDEDVGKAIEKQVSKLESIRDEVTSAEDALWDIEDQLYELTQRGRDEYIDFQKDVYNALIKQRQDEIDKYSEYISTLADAKNDILDELRKYIDKQRQERDNAEKEKEIADKDAQLFRMERDTGSTQSDIIAARKDVEQMRRDYTDDLIDQKISELEEQNDEAQKIREKQLEIMQKQLDQDEKSGALWEQVKVLMEEGWGPDGKIIEGSELERILADYYEYTQMSEEERAKAIEQRNMNTTLAKQYLDAKNAGKNKYTPSTSYPDINKTQTPKTQTPKKNPSSNSGAKTLSVGTRVRTVGYGNAASDGSGGRAAKGLSGRKILKVRKGAKYPYLIGTSNDPSGWTGWYTASALQAYKKGGLANFTGPAWLDGTKTKPEAVLNARDTQNFLQLRDVLSDVLNKSRTIERSNSENNGDNYYDIDIQVDKLSNDYDVDQLVKKIKKEITRDANYRNVRTINLKR
jgi:TP901 family phage tail tape measure protein